jgi:hypothetical protein
VRADSVRGDTVLSCDIGGLAAHLASVDALARFELAARRRGLRLELHGASRELQDLLDLAGLCLVPVPGGSGLELRGKAEQGEQLGVQERGDLADPPA